MKIIKIIAFVIVIFLSLAAGAAKVMKVPQEKVFFEALGLNGSAMIGFGALQIIAALLTALPQSRRYGAALAGLMFLLSAVMIFATGQIPFGLISLLPAALAFRVAVSSKKV